MKDYKVLDSLIELTLMYSGISKNIKELKYEYNLDQYVNDLEQHISACQSLRKQYFKNKTKFVSEEILRKFEHDYTPFCEFMNWVRLEYKDMINLSKSWDSDLEVWIKFIKSILSYLKNTEREYKNNDQELTAIETPPDADIPNDSTIFDEEQSPSKLKHLNIKLNNLEENKSYNPKNSSDNYEKEFEVKKDDKTILNDNIAISKKSLPSNDNLYKNDNDLIKENHSPSVLKIKIPSSPVSSGQTKSKPKAENVKLEPKTINETVETSKDQSGTDRSIGQTL